MKKQFQSQLQAIEWIANYAKDEGHFEVIRETLLFYYIYTSTYFIALQKETSNGEVTLYDSRD